MSWNVVPVCGDCVVCDLVFLKKRIHHGDTEKKEKVIERTTSSVSESCLRKKFLLRVLGVSVVRNSGGGVQHIENVVGLHSMRHGAGVSEGRSECDRGIDAMLHAAVIWYNPSMGKRIFGPVSGGVRR